MARVLEYVRRNYFLKNIPPEEGVLGLTIARYLAHDRQRIFRTFWVALVYSELDEEAAEIRMKYLKGDERWYEPA